MWKIKNVEINGKIVVAPMAGISNMTFRRICKSMGASLVVAEMVSDKAITYGNEKTFELLRMNDDERPISQQIFGSDVKSFVEAAKIVEEKMKPDIIDINMGCPVPKVAVKNQAGSALLKNPEKVGEIIKAVVNAVNIPVIGNGDVVSCYDAKKMLDETGCSAVMIGRGLLGNPWLIKECVEYLESGKLPEVIGYNEKIDMMEYHLNKLCEDKTEKQAVLEIRNHLLNYLKGLPENKEVKNQVCRCKSRLEIIEVLENYRNELKNL